MIKIKDIFHFSVFGINIIAIVLFLLSAYSDLISPESFILFPFLGICFPFILVVNLFFFIWWLLLKQWKKLLVCVIAFIICIPSIHTYFPVHFKTDTIPAGSIKLLTYNVMRFNHMKSHKNDDPNQVIRYIVENDADIVCIQEYGAHSSSNFLTEKDIKRILKFYPYYHIYKLKANTREQAYGMAIFSKFSISSIKSINLDSRYNGSFECQLNINGKTVTLINNHLESNKLSKEERHEYAEFLNDFDSGKFDMITGKILRRLIPAFELRAKQAEIISNAIKANKNPYIIVCGDFNDTPISYARHTIKGDLKDAFVSSGFGPGITYNQDYFYFRIDYILHSKNIKAYNCTVDNVAYSDHYPLWTYLHLEE